MSFYFDPHAIRELQQATDYYSSISHTLGEAFACEMDRVIKRILSLPRAWTIITASIRRCRARGFPYAVIYRIKDEQIEILAVMHISREPNYWISRINEQTDSENG
jgi:hypothetical protein